MSYPVPHNENERVEDLKSYLILDTEPDLEYQQLAEAAALVCHCPVALIGFIEGDRHWVKAKKGLEVSEIPRHISLCAHAIMSDEPLICRNTLTDMRFFNNPIVDSPEGFRFYAGIPLISSSGYAIGVICVADYVIRDLTPEQLSSLRKVADRVLRILEIKKIAWSHIMQDK